MREGWHELPCPHGRRSLLSGKLPLPDDRVYAAPGALGTLTDNATYDGLGLNSSLIKFAFDNIEDDKLAGSADGYPEVPNHDRLFLQYFARDCTGLEAITAGSPCYSIGDLFPACYDPADLTCDMLVLSLRNYIRPGTQRGPKPELTLSPRFIPVQRKAPPCGRRYSYCRCPWCTQ